MSGICKVCKKSKNGYCMISSKKIDVRRSKCPKFKLSYKQQTLFDAVGENKYGVEQ